MATSIFSPSSNLPIPEELVPPADPTLFEVYKAQLAYSYNPLLSHIKSNLNPENFYRAEDYNPFEEDFTGYEEHKRYLLENAANPEHMGLLKERIDTGNKSRSVIGRSSFTQQLVAGMFDPVNAVTLPFGGPSIGFFRSGLRVGAGVGAITVAQEFARAPFDPVNKKGESVMNVGMGVAAGFVLGGGLSFLKYTPRERQAIEDLKRDAETQMAEKTTYQHQEFVNRLPREDRKFSSMNDDIIRSTLKKDDGQLKKLQNNYDIEINKRDNLLDIVRESPQFKSLENTITKLTNEQVRIREDIDGIFGGSFISEKDLSNNLFLQQSKTIISKKAKPNPRFVEAQKKGLADGKESRGVLTPKILSNIKEYKKQNLDVSDEIYKNAVLTQVPRSRVKLRAIDKVVDIEQLAQRVGIVSQKINLDEQDAAVLKDLFTELRNINTKLIAERSKIDKSYAKELDKLEKKINSLKVSMNLKQDVVNELTIENDLRLMEASEFGVEIKQDDNWWTRSAFNKWVHTPLKDLINSNAPNFVKKYAMDIAADGGFITNVHKMGYSMGQSVYMNQHIYKGEVQTTIKSLQDLWAEAGKKKQMTFLMYNVSNSLTKFNNKFRAKSAKDITFEKWTENLNKKRVQGASDSELTDIEKRGIKVINDFYDRWEGRLKEVGMIGDEKYFKGLQIVRADQLEKFENTLKNLLEKRDQGLEFYKNKEQSIAKGKDIVSNLLREQKSRGLTPKQKELLDKLQKTIPMDERELKRLSKAGNKAGLTKDQLEYIQLLEKDTLPRLRKEFANIEKQLEVFQDTRVRPANETVMHPRYWNKLVIKKNIGAFKNILREYYANNPTVTDRQLDGTFKETTITSDNIDKWVDDLVNDIVSQEDILDPSKAFYGMGKSKHLQHRAIDIPNKLVFDYIQQNPVQVMGAYIARTAPAYEFNLKFGGRNYGELVDEIRSKSFDEGRTTEEVDSYVMNFSHLYDRVVGAVAKEPSRLSFRIANGLRTAAQLNYLGSAGLSAISEPFKIIFENGAKNTFRGLLTGIDIRLQKQFAKQSANEAMLSGEALEPVFGSVHMRLVDELTLNPFNHTVWDKAKDGFYVLNLLGPITNALKQWTGITNQHTIIETLEKVAKKTADQNDLVYLARYGLEPSDAIKASELIANGTIQKSPRGLYMANTEAWTDLPFQKKFRVALSNNIMNTIMMGTPADKPKIVDGVAYIPKKFAKFFPFKALKEDERVSGYMRIENGFMGLPFQFYSYSLAAVNKVNNTAASGQGKSKAMAATTAIGLAYFGQWLRTPSYVWDRLGQDDKVMRAFDYSGLASLYSGLFYEAMHTSLALGGPNISGGMLQPKFNVENKGVESVVGLSGAGPSWFYDFATNSFELAFDKNLDYSEGAYQFVNGDRGNAAKGLMRSFPFVRVPYWKQEVYDLTNAIDRNVD